MNKVAITLIGVLAIAGVAIAIWFPGPGIALSLMVIVWLLFEIHVLLFGIQARLTEIQTDLNSDERDRVSLPNSYVSKRRTVFHDILDQVKENR